MNSDEKATLSALIDGESESLEERRFLRDFDPALAMEAAQSWQLIGRVLRGGQDFDADLAGQQALFCRIQAEIAAEPDLAVVPEKKTATIGRPWIYGLAASVLIVGIFKMVTMTGLSGSLWGVIIPGAATPTGVFMLRQYMLTIPDELLEAARMDAASEWTIYWRIIFPLALPAIAVLGILSIIWRWNDLILPMIAVSTTKAAYTIQLCLLDFNGEYLAREHYALAMTVVSLIPTTLVFVFLQKYITTGIASTGMK